MSLLSCQITRRSKNYRIWTYLFHRRAYSTPKPSPTPHQPARKQSIPPGYSSNYTSKERNTYPYQTTTKPTNNNTKYNSPSPSSEYYSNKYPPPAPLPPRKNYHNNSNNNGKPKPGFFQSKQSREWKPQRSVNDSATLFEPWTAELIEETKTTMITNTTLPSRSVSEIDQGIAYYDSTPFLLKHQRRLSKLSKAAHKKPERQKSKWAKREDERGPEEEERIIDEREEGTKEEKDEEEGGDNVNYWDKVAKIRDEQQEVYKHELVELLSRRHAKVELASTESDISPFNNSGTIYTDDEIACLLKIRDPLWRALTDIRPPYKSHENYLHFLTERLNNKATTESYNKVLKYTTQAQRLELAERIFDDMLQTGVSPNAETFNWIIRNYMQNCHVDKAITYFSQMLKHNSPPNLATYGFMIHGLLDNSRFNEARALLSPAKMQYALSDELSFATLLESFQENRELDVRTWLSQFLPSSAKTQVQVQRVEHVGGKGTKLEGKFYVTHRAELHAIYTHEDQPKTVSIKHLFTQHVSRAVRKQHIDILNDLMPWQLEVDSDGVPIEQSLVSLLSKVKSMYEIRHPPKKKKSIAQK